MNKDNNYQFIIDSIPDKDLEEFLNIMWDFMNKLPAVSNTKKVKALSIHYYLYQHNTHHTHLTNLMKKLTKKQMKNKKKNKSSNFLTRIKESRAKIGLGKIIKNSNKLIKWITYSNIYGDKRSSIKNTLSRFIRLLIRIKKNEINIINIFP